MFLKELGQKINNLIFGNIIEMSMRRKVYILLTFLSSMIILIGFISNVALGLNIYANIVTFVAFLIVITLYYIARNKENYLYTIIPLFISSLVLLSLSWFFNGGYDGNLPSLFLIFFTAIYVIVSEKHRKLVFIFYTSTYGSLLLIQHFYPNFIINYDNPQQRFIDLFVGGILYSITMYFIIDIIVKNYKVEIEVNKQINSELIEKNLEIARSNSKLEDSYQRLSMAMTSSKQGWFDLDIPTGKVEVSQEYPNLIGYTYEEFDSSFQNWIMNIHPDDVKEVLDIFNKAMLQKTISTVIYRRKIKSGDWIWMQSTGKVIEYDEAGNPKRMIGTHMDISEQKMAEQALRDSEEKYRALINNSMEGIAILDMAGTIIFANTATCKTLKIIDVRNLIGRKVFEFITPESLPKVIKDFENVLNGIDSYISEYSCFNAEGEELWIESVGKIIQYEGKTADLISIRDVTDKKRAEKILKESELKYRELFDTMPNGFYRSTPDGYFVDANPALIKMLGYESLEELKKVHIPTEIYVEESERNDFQDYNTEFTNQLETYRLIRKDGEVVWFEDNARYIKDNEGNIIFHEGIIKDITERKKAEADLKASEESLKKLNATKDKFFSIIAHDLRNPLGNFVSVLSYLYEFYNVLSEEEKIEYISNTKDSASGILSLLENLLEWSRSQRGMITINPNEFCIRMIANNTISILKLSADEKNIRLENNIPEPTMINTDANLVSTIIRNLTSNAIKFTPIGGSIELGIKMTKDPNLTVFVKDSGVGMSKETIDKLFRIDESITTKGTSGEKGTGLGLILCKEFVEKLGGNIWVESELGKGTTFYFTLPNL